MTTATAQPVKILFRFYSEMLDQIAVETIWAEPVDSEQGLYRVDTVPFYVPKLASDDIVRAEYDEDEEMLTYKETVEPSGNSTVWVVIIDDADQIEEVMESFVELDCYTEALSDRYFTMEIKAANNYLRIRNKLNEWKSAGVIDYAEPCISQVHQY
ncbi:MAG TPA: DUF4265 domain-containing protein [Puia sp.]|nr:DUF4265 domain-containing protein [Puia sp.]